MNEELKRLLATLMIDGNLRMRLNKILDESSPIIHIDLRGFEHGKKLEVGKKDLPALMEICQAIPTLQSLTLQGHDIDDESADSLIKIITSTKLETFNIFSSNIGEEGAIKIATAISTHGHIKTFCLHGNSINDQAVVAIADKLKSNGNIKRLSIQGKYLCDQGIIALLNLLSSNRLEQLSITGRSSNDVTCREIGKILAQDKQLQTFVLEVDELADVRMVLDGIRSNISLRDVIVIAHNIGSTDASIINKELEDIKMRNQFYIDKLDPVYRDHIQYTSTAWVLRLFSMEDLKHEGLIAAMKSDILNRTIDDTIWWQKVSWRDEFDRSSQHPTVQAFFRIFLGEVSIRANLYLIADKDSFVSKLFIPENLAVIVNAINRFAINDSLLRSYFDNLFIIDSLPMWVRTFFHHISTQYFLFHLDKNDFLQFSDSHFQKLNCDRTSTPSSCNDSVHESVALNIAMAVVAERKKGRQIVEIVNQLVSIRLIESITSARNLSLTSAIYMTSGSAKWLGEHKGAVYFKAQLENGFVSLYCIGSHFRPRIRSARKIEIIGHYTTDHLYLKVTTREGDFLLYDCADNRVLLENCDELEPIVGPLELEQYDRLYLKICYRQKLSLYDAKYRRFVIEDVKAVNLMSAGEKGILFAIQKEEQWQIGLYRGDYSLNSGWRWFTEGDLDIHGIKSIKCVDDSNTDVYFEVKDLENRLYFLDMSMPKPTVKPIILEGVEIFFPHLCSETFLHGEYSYEFWVHTSDGDIAYRFVDGRYQIIKRPKMLSVVTNTGGGFECISGSQVGYEYCLNDNDWRQGLEYGNRRSPRKGIGEMICYEQYIVEHNCGKWSISKAFNRNDGNIYVGDTKPRYLGADYFEICSSEKTYILDAAGDQRYYIEPYQKIQWIKVEGNEPYFLLWREKQVELCDKNLACLQRFDDIDASFGLRTTVITRAEHFNELFNPPRKYLKVRCQGSDGGWVLFDILQRRYFDYPLAHDILWQRDGIQIIYDNHIEVIKEKEIPNLGDLTVLGPHLELIKKQLGMYPFDSALYRNYVLNLGKINTLPEFIRTHLDCELIHFFLVFLEYPILRDFDESWFNLLKANSKLFEIMRSYSQHTINNFTVLFREFQIRQFTEENIAYVLNGVFPLCEIFDEEKMQVFSQHSLTILNLLLLSLPCSEKYLRWLKCEIKDIEIIKNRLSYLSDLFIDQTHILLFNSIEDSIINGKIFEEFCSLLIVADELDVLLPKDAKDFATFGKEMSAQIYKNFAEKLPLTTSDKEDFLRNSWNISLLPKLWYAYTVMDDDHRKYLKLFLLIPAIHFNETVELTSYSTKLRDQLSSHDVVLEALSESRKREFKDYPDFKMLRAKIEAIIPILKRNLGKKGKPQVDKLLEQYKQQLSFETICGLIELIQESLHNSEYQYTDALRKLWDRWESNLIEDVIKGGESNFFNYLRMFLQCLLTQKCIENILGKSCTKEIMNLISNLNSRHYYIEIWNRCPRECLILGSKAQSCIALDRPQREAVVDYLLDEAIQIFRIYKQQPNGMTIELGYARTFLGWDEDGHSCIVVDGLEGLGNGEVIKKRICNELIQLVMEYADALHVSNILMNKVLNYANDDYDTRELTITKAGGSLFGKFYLHSFYDTTGGWIKADSEGQIRAIAVFCVIRGNFSPHLDRHKVPTITQDKTQSSHLGDGDLPERTTDQSIHTTELHNHREDNRSERFFPSPNYTTLAAAPAGGFSNRLRADSDAGDGYESPSKTCH